MPLVYSQATVTIGASRATSVEEGFFHDRSASGLTFELQYRSPAVESSTVILHPTAMGIRRVTEPLNQRAWALQERLLSGRLLEFGTFQTIWICRENRTIGTLSCYFDGTAFSQNDDPDDLVHELNSLLRMTAQESKTINDDLLALWHRIVKIYTCRNMTLPTDRLPAISGIAAQFGRVTRDDYKAGLWKSRLREELLWTVISRGLNPRSKVYQGPSWSWAAIGHPVLIDIDQNIDPEFEIIDCQTELQTQSPYYSIFDARFGAVQSGSMAVKGRLLQAEWIRDRDSTVSWEGNVLRRSDTGEKLVMTIQPDAIEDEFLESGVGFIPVFLLKITFPGKSAIIHPDARARGLVLRRLDDGTFSRLGVFSVGPYSGNFLPPGVDSVSGVNTEKTESESGTGLGLESNEDDDNSGEGNSKASDGEGKGAQNNKVQSGGGQRSGEEHLDVEKEEKSARQTVDCNHFDVLQDFDFDTFLREGDSSSDVFQAFDTDSSFYQQESQANMDEISLLNTGDLETITIV